MTTSRKQRHKDCNRKVTRDPLPLLKKWLEDLYPSPKKDYLLKHVFSKFVSADTDPPKVRYQRALCKWLAAEATNSATNDRLLTMPEDYQILPRVTFGQFMQTVQRFIVDIVGDIPPSDVIYGSFSGGATTSRNRTESHPALKYVGQADVTSRAKDLFLDVLEDSPLWSSFFDMDSIRIVEGNVLFTVPKNTEIDRCACKEPDLNMYMQKGVGQSIRELLLRKGINLNDQSINRSLAKIGSTDGSLATLDLSSASDSISRELVFQLMPIHWFTLLDTLRSPTTRVNGEVHELQMFSSMGNGFTFELESLLFYCISRAVAYHQGTPGVISVYGDDIICPTEIANDLTFVLEVLGFEVNTKKSCITGPIRESCGGHYYNGLDVTPFYIRKPVTHLIDLIHLLNQMRKWSQDDGFSILNPELDSIWWELAREIPLMFWGGHDTADKSRLVSDWKPTKPRRLQQLRTVRRVEEGGYLLWHDSRKTQQTIPGSQVYESIPNSQGEVSTDIAVYQPRPVGWVGKPDAILLSEVTADFCEDIPRIWR